MLDMIEFRTKFFLIIIVCVMMIENVFGQIEVPRGVTGETSKTGIFDSQNLNKKIASLPIPQTIYPANGATDVPIIPQLILKTVIGADRYEIQVANDHNFSCDFFSCSILSYSWWQFDSPTTEEYLLEWFPGIPNSQTFQINTVYYWRVRALNTSSGEQSDWSPPSKYITVSSGSSISQPTLLSPSPSTTVPWLNIELKWNQVSNATWYQIQWSTNNSFNSFFYHWSRGDSPSWIINVKPKTTYYWRVIAFNDKGVSTFSNTRSFQTSTQVTLTDPTRIFDDGSGTDNYDNNLDVFWLIKPTSALPNSKIKLSFLSLDTENGYDFVTIYDGETTSSTILGKFSGTTIPASISSSGPSMLVRFTSDAAKTEKGWSANYECFWIPSSQEISDYADQLSSTYKAPSVIIKALIEKESIDWKQFDSAGDPIISADGGIGLLQVTPTRIPSFPTVSLGKIIEGVSQGSNQFTTIIETTVVDVNRLKWDWRYNLETGIRILVAKKVESGGSTDDARILENWYYPLAYYNGVGNSTTNKKCGFVDDLNNNPANSKYSRRISSDPILYGDKKIFPYQECVYNIIAQLYPVPYSRKSFFGPAIKATLPGPQSVKTGDGAFDYVSSLFGFFDWATYFSNGEVKIGSCGNNSSECASECKVVSNISAHIVPFGTPGITVTRTVSTAGLINFSPTGNQTALTIDFKSLSGSGSCTVDFLASGPSQAGFVGNTPNNISPYRWVIAQDGLASFLAELKFDLSQLPFEIVKSSTVKIYSRSSPGLGLFTELPTTYEATSNTLRTTVTGFSEFIFGSNEPLTIVAENNHIPNGYFLSQNYPNPFNPTTTIKFSIPSETFHGTSLQHVVLKVYDLLGREVTTLVNEEKTPGEYSVEFRALPTGRQVQSLPSGVYFYRLTAGSFSESKKMILLK